MQIVGNGLAYANKMQNKAYLMGLYLPDPQLHVLMLLHRVTKLTIVDTGIVNDVTMLYSRIRMRQIFQMKTLSQTRKS